MGLAVIATFVSANGAQAGHTLCSALIGDVIREATAGTGPEEPATSLYCACASCRN